MKLKFFIICITILLSYNTFSAKTIYLKENNYYRFRHKVILPPDYKFMTPKRLIGRNSHYTVQLFSRGYSQGDAIYIEIIPRYKFKGKVILKKVYFGKKRVILIKKSWGYRGFFGIAPWQKPGYKKLKIEHKLWWKSKQYSYTYSFKTKKTPFPVYRKAFKVGKYSNKSFTSSKKNRALIKRAIRLKTKAFRSREKNRINMILSHPRDHHRVTSPFWAQRVYLRYKYINGKKIRLKNTLRIHKGLDLKALWGRPIFAIAGGKIVLSHRLFWEGNMIVIDHGNKIFSYYMHMSRLRVKKNQVISAGKKIGDSGSTGISTAAHLHVSMMINGILVDPMSFLCLPVR